MRFGLTVAPSVIGQLQPVISFASSYRSSFTSRDRIRIALSFEILVRPKLSLSAKPPLRKCCRKWLAFFIL